MENQQHRILRSDLGKALGHDNLVPDAVRLETGLAGLHRGDHRLMTGQHTVLAVQGGQHQAFHRTGEKLAFRGDDFQLKGLFHQTAPCARAFSRTSSTVPTEEKAGFGVFVQLTAQQSLKALEGFAQRHIPALQTGELFGHEEGLGEELLHTARAGDGGGGHPRTVPPCPEWR